MSGSAQVRNKKVPYVLLLLAGLALTSWPVVKRLDQAYPRNYHGNLTAWFALMSENMVRHGFAQTRFMPVLNPDASGTTEPRYYLTHPVLDVVVRAVLIRALGAKEWVVRLQGVFGCFASALVLFFIVRRRTSDLGALAASVGMAALPLFQRLAHLSMQHPMTLLFSLIGLLFFERYRERSSRSDYAAMLVAFLLAMNFDWPGYFMPFLVWIRHLVGFRGGLDRRIVLGLPALVALSLTWFFVHVEVIVDPAVSLARALTSASRIVGPDLTRQEALARVFAYQRDGFLWIGLLAALGAPLLVLARGPARRALGLWLLFFVLGALHLVVFPTKAPYHDFWGAYWLPCVGLSFGIVISRVEARLGGPLRPKVTWMLTGLVLGLATAQAALAPWDDAGAREGERHREQAAQLLALVPPQDRGLFITDYAGFDFMILGAYLRVNLLPVPDLTAADVTTLPSLAQRDFFHVRGRRTLFFVAPSRERSEATGELIQALSRVGTPYRDLPFVFDLTDFIWAK